MKEFYERPTVSRLGNTNLLSGDVLLRQRMRYLIRLLDRKADVLLRDDTDIPQAPDTWVA